MKNIYLVGFLLVLLSACGNEETDSVSLNGEIKGLGNDTLYLYGADGLYNRMDTLIVTNDKFAVTLHPDTLVATWLQFGNGTEYPLFLDKGNHIQIEGSAAELATLSITGNKPNEELTAFQKELKGLGTPSDKVLEEKAEAFINAHPSSLVSIYLLDKYFVQNPLPDFAFIKQLTDRMTGELKDRPYMDKLLDRLEEEEKAGIGKMVPFFRLPNAEGKNISRTSFKDKYLLLNFWASWNPQSKKANDSLRQLYKKEEKNKYFAFLGISLDIDKKAWKESIRKDTLRWEQVCDFSGWETGVVKQLAVHALPANVLLGPTGKIEGKNLSREEVEEKIKQIEQEEEKKEKEKSRLKRERKRQQSVDAH